MPGYAVTVTAEFEEITKATPFIKNNPEPSDINYGEKLSSSTLYGGYVQVSSTDSTQVAGLFTWTEPDTIPAIADSDVALYSVTFTPVDEDNYNTVSCQVTIRVNHTHNPVLVKGQAATAEAAGWKDYYECFCGDLFEDANGITPIEDLAAWKAEGGRGYIAPLAPAIKLGNLEFTISQNDSIGEDGKSIVYENGYKLSVAYEGMGDNVISTVNEHTELRDIPDGTSVTFTLTVPQGETKVPDLMMSGARETFTDNTFTTNLDFSQNTVIIVSLDFGNDPGPGQEDGHIVKIQINNNDGANGTIQYKFDTEAAFTSKTAADKDGGGNIRIEIPEGAAAVTFKAVPDGEFTLQDCTILYDDQDIDETKAYMADVGGDGYVYALPDDDKTIVFRADFGNELLPWHAVSWGGGNVTIENGTVEAYAVHVGEKTYDESVKTADETEKLYPLSDITGVDIQTHPVSFGDTDMFISDENTDAVSIDFRFIPDYGYQVTDIKATEDSLLEFFTPGEEISTFHFAYEPLTNVHFIVEFTAAEDIIDSAASNFVTGASIENGGNATNSGNLKMTISDVDKTSVSDGLKGEVADNEALYLDLELAQVVSKTGSNGNWETELTDLDATSDVTLEMNPSEIDPMAQYYIIREHETVGGAEYKTIPVEFDSEKGAFTFSTDKFSTYALVKDIFGNGEFMVNYDFRGDENCGVMLGSEMLSDCTPYTFSPGEQIEFTLFPPEDRFGDTPIVEIEVFDGDDATPNTVWRSDFDSGNVLQLIDRRSFTFTPATDSALIIRIWWCAYDAFGPTEGQYMIETNILGDGSVRYSPLGAACDRYCEEGIPRKDCYEVGTGVTMTFVPTEGSELFSVVVDDKNGHREYTSEPQEWPTAPLSDILDAGSGNYQIEITDANEGDYFYVEAVFDDVVAPPAPAYYDPDPVVNVPVSGDESSIKVKATVSGNTATVQPITKAEIEKVVGSDVDTGMVEIDLSGLKQDVTGVKLPTETVEAIAEAAAETGNDTAGLALKLASGTLEFDAKALETIVKAAGNAKNIEIHFDNVGITRLNADQKAAVSEMIVVGGFEAYVTVNGKRVSDFNGGSVTIYIPYEIPEGNNHAGYTVWFVAEDGTLEKQNATYDGTNHRFVVSHFSDYVLTYDETVGAYSNCPKDETCPIEKFTDTKNDAWWHDGIHYCLDNRLMVGVSATNFDPTGDITRGMIVTMLWRLEGKPVINYAMSFKDVPAEQWYTEAIRWAAAEKIVNGYDAEHFGPTDPITREQLATILYNYAKYKGQGFTGDWMFLLDFVDRADISSWADEAVHWCSMKGIVNGKDGKVFDPQGTATRAEAASMIQRFCEALEK